MATKASTASNKNKMLQKSKGDNTQKEGDGTSVLLFLRLLHCNLRLHDFEEPEILQRLFSATRHRPTNVAAAITVDITDHPKDLVSVVDARATPLASS